MNICTVGTGFITRIMLQEFQRSDVLHCTAICSRSEEKGRAMAEEFGIETVYLSLEAMLADPAIDLVYIASPNSIHFAQTKACLLAGKHVLCEKPFAPTVAEAEELIALAKEKHLFLFEAITTAHHPNYELIRKQIPQLGNITSVQCTFCQYSSRYPVLLAGKAAPVLDPSYKGGALMDINLYNIHFVVGLFGAPTGVHYFPRLYSNGVDTNGLLLLEYPDFLCQCVGAKDSTAENGAQIIGENGYIKVSPSTSNCASAALCLRGKDPEVTTYEDTGWHFEVESIGKLLAENNYDACYKALETTKSVVSVLEQARTDGALGY